jgi:ribosomal protein L11 methyltransferase
MISQRQEVSFIPMHEEIREGRPPGYRGPSSVNPPNAGHAPRVDLIVKKGTEEILPEFVFTECGGVWIDELNGDTLIRCYPEKAGPFLRHVRDSGLPVKDIKVVKEALQDYVALTKKYFRPIKVSGVRILAPWQKSRDPGPRIVIEPGMAFGTGRHESTKLMLRMMNAVLLKGRSVLDLGCGSGILAIYAALKGAKKVMAVDSDTCAVEGSRRNFALNKMDSIGLACTDLADIRGTFDVVLANLDFDTCRKHCQAIAERLVHGGCLLVSGIEAQYANSLLTIFNDHTLLRTFKMNDWHGFTFKEDHDYSPSPCPLPKGRGNMITPKQNFEESID